MEEVWNLDPSFPRVLDGWSAIEAFEFPSAIREGRQSFSQNPGREPSLCCLETLEALDGLQSAIELFIHALNEIRCSGTINVEERFRFHVGGEFLTALEDVIEGGDLHGIIVMTGRSPPDARL